MYEFRKQAPKSAYPPIAILKTAYMFLDKAYVHIGETEREWIIDLSPKRDAVFAQECAEEFENELIAQALRERVYQRTKTLRETLLARAMTSTLISREDPIAKMEEEADASSEELNEILTDWFERYEKDS